MCAVVSFALTLVRVGFVFFALGLGRVRRFCFILPLYDGSRRCWPCAAVVSCVFNFGLRLVQVVRAALVFGPSRSYVVKAHAAK